MTALSRNEKNPHPPARMRAGQDLSFVLVLVAMLHDLGHVIIVLTEIGRILDEFALLTFLGSLVSGFVIFGRLDFAGRLLDNGLLLDDRCRLLSCRGGTSRFRRRVRLD